MPAAASASPEARWAVKPGSLAAVSEATIRACTWPRSTVSSSILSSSDASSDWYS